MDPIRSCIVCRKKNSKKDLFKIVSKDKIAFYDKKQNINSRSIYICKNQECINKCKKIISKDKLNTKLSIENESMLKVLLELENELGD